MKLRTQLSNFLLTHCPPLTQRAQKQRKNSTRLVNMSLKKMTKFCLSTLSQFKTWRNLIFILLSKRTVNLFWWICTIQRNKWTDGKTTVRRTKLNARWNLKHWIAQFLSLGTISQISGKTCKSSSKLKHSIKLWLKTFKLYSKTESLSSCL